MSSKIILGNNLKLFREKLGLSQQQLADYLDINREGVSYYENAQRNMPLHLVQKTANLFGVDEYDLEEVGAEEQELNLSFAFRAEELSKEDLVSVAKFKSIAKNYLNMLKHA
jgi:transcriptional regulator with XRE-family HTH domain